MKLFIGNVTPQNHIFLYRLPEIAKIIDRPIGPGKQVEIGGDLDTETIEYVLAQHRRYGLLPIDELSRVRGFRGLCYSIGKPIPADKLTYLRDHNLGELADEGRELRRAAAIVGNEFLETALRENDRPERVEQFDLYIQEDRQEDSELPQISEKIVVTRNPGQPAPTPSRAARRAMKRAA